MPFTFNIKVTVCFLAYICVYMDTEVSSPKVHLYIPLKGRGVNWLHFAIRV